MHAVQNAGALIGANVFDFWLGTNWLFDSYGGKAGRSQYYYNNRYKKERFELQRISAHHEP